MQFDTGRVTQGAGQQVRVSTLILARLLPQMTSNGPSLEVTGDSLREAARDLKGDDET